MWVEDRAPANYRRS